jgi:hypothetical protein
MKAMTDWEEVARACPGGVLLMSVTTCPLARETQNAFSPFLIYGHSLSRLLLARAKGQLVTVIRTERKLDDE